MSTTRKRGKNGSGITSLFLSLSLHLFLSLFLLLPIILFVFFTRIGTPLL